MKTLEANGQGEHLSKENTKENKMQIWELKIIKAKIKIKKSVKGLTRKMEETEERISEIEDT